MNRSYTTTDFLKLVSIAVILNAAYLAGTLNAKYKTNEDKKDLQKAAVISRISLVCDDMILTRFYLDMDGNTNTVEATCDMGMNLPSLDPSYKKVFPDGSVRTMFEWKKMGHFSMAKSDRGL